MSMVAVSPKLVSCNARCWSSSKAAGRLRPSAALSESQVPGAAEQQARCLEASSLPQEKDTSCPTPLLGRRALVGGALSATLVLPKPAPARAELGTFCEDFKLGADGMFYCDQAVGKGKVVAPGDTISCHYISRLGANGFKFDSSYDYMGGETPFEFKVGSGEVIRGWDLGILGSGDDMPPMRVGGKRTLIIPSELGYGRWGAGDQVPPDAVLVYDIEVTA